MAPRASVVIPTYNRRDLLARLLDGLAAQDTAEFEVVTVDDCSTDGTWEWLQGVQESFPFALRPARTPRNAGPATARNIGWRSAEAPWIAFIDDDCVPEPQWLGTLLGAADEGAGVVQGSTLPFPEQAAGRGPFARFVWVDRDYGRYETCNILYRRSLLDQLGGFDESFGTVGGAPVWGEDTDLGWRAQEAGAVVRFEPDARAWCQVYPSNYVTYMKELRRRGGLVRNVARHPGLRKHYPMGVFMQESHPLAVLALGGVVTGVLGRSSPAAWAAAAVMAVPYGWYRTVANPWTCRRRNIVPVLALGWVADLADTGVLAAASVRYRTLFI